MVNIETAGSIAVSGTDTDPLIQAIAVELATAQWTDQIDLVLVGFGEENEGLERVSHAEFASRSGAPRWSEELGSEQRCWPLSTVPRTPKLGGSTVGMRGISASWSAPPNARADESDALDELVEVAGDGSLGVAVICGCDVMSARWRVRADGGRVSTEGVGRGWSSLSRQPVPPNFARRRRSPRVRGCPYRRSHPRQAPYDELLSRTDREPGSGPQPVSRRWSAVTMQVSRPRPAESSRPSWSGFSAQWRSLVLLDNSPERGRSNSSSIWLCTRAA